MPPLGDAPGIMPKRRFPRGFRALRGNVGDARRPASEIAGRAAADAREAAARDRNRGSSPPNGRFAAAARGGRRAVGGIPASDGGIEVSREVLRVEVGGGVRQSVWPSVTGISH